MLTNCNDSSLVVDSLCDRAISQKFAVACFYFDFAAQKEQSLAGMLGALLKQVVSGRDGIPKKITQAYEDQKMVIGGRGPQLSDIVGMLQTAASEKRTFICIDALDECVAAYRVKLLDSLGQILQGNPGTRVFITGRAHIEAEVERRLPRRVTTLLTTPRRHDIISYLHNKLDEDTTPDAMDSSLKVDIIKKISEGVSGTYVEVIPDPP